jgi:hypothetical protein
VRYTISEEIGVSYCSNMIQNKIISVMVLCVHDSVVERGRKEKYFSVILDCTRDLAVENKCHSRYNLWVYVSLI